MEWLYQLKPKDRRGSRPRCVLLMDGNRDEVAQKLTRLMNLPDVVVNPTDKWIPWGKPVQLNSDKWDKSPANEAELHKAHFLLPRDLRVQLRDWWLAVPKNSMTPNWDIASTCSIDGEPGLLLVEAKAHAAELVPKSDRCGSSNDENRERIRQAISQAAGGFAYSYRRPLEPFPRPPLPTVQPVCLGLETGIFGCACCPDVLRVSQRPGHGWKRVVQVSEGLGTLLERVW